MMQSWMGFAEGMKWSASAFTVEHCGFVVAATALVQLTDMLSIN